ncbi:hypothetical protein [Bordetella trematum]|uniref:hypothetical protein n=1 Tax=Bordetella trematum TaxID=123899 RepID=UPI003AF3D036
MAEFNSVQAQKVADRKKLIPAESFGRQRVLIATLPASHASFPANSTILLGVVPVNSRFLTGGVVSVGGAGTASSTVDIGIRKASTQEVLSAAGIATAVDIAAAATVPADTGDLIAAAADYITPADVEVYATVKGAALAANQKIRFEIPYVTD